MPDRQYQPVDVQLRPKDFVCSGPDGCGAVLPVEDKRRHESFHLFRESRERAKGTKKDQAQLLEQQAAEQRHRETLGRFNPAIEHRGVSL